MGTEPPWELSASMLGGSALADGYSEEQKRETYNYFIRACLPDDGAGALRHTKLGQARLRHIRISE